MYEYCMYNKHQRTLFGSKVYSVRLTRWRERWGAWGPQRWRAAGRARGSAPRTRAPCRWTRSRARRSQPGARRAGRAARALAAWAPRQQVPWASNYGCCVCGFWGRQVEGVQRLRWIAPHMQTKINTWTCAVDGWRMLEKWKQVKYEYNVAVSTEYVI